jgi:tetratricopeptide (TPR) repeat protein
LGQVDPDRLSVIGRTTMMTYKATTKTVSEISRELNAEYLIESSIRMEGGKLRIRSGLVRGRDQVQVWSASYDSEPNSMLAFQRELGIAIAGQIRLQLSPERLMVALARRQTQSAEAFDQYLRGRYFWNQLSPATTRRAVEYYTRATQLDPGYALGWSGLADAFAASPINGDAPPLEAWPRAREAATHAVSSDANLAEAQTSLGMVGFFLDWDWVAAEVAFRKAVALDPGYCLAHRTLGILLSHSSRHEEAKIAVSRARTLEPLYAAHHALSAQVAFNAREYTSAVHFARLAIVVDSGFWIGYLQLAQALQQSGDSDLALDALQTAWRLSGGNTKVVALRGYILARLGRTQEALEILSTLKGLSDQRYIPPYTIALVYAGLGNRDATFEWLENAIEGHDVHVIFLPVDPKWDDFRNDSQFLSISSRCDFDRTHEAQLNRAGVSA